MSHLILLAVPLFVFLGLLIEMTGMARAMVAFLASLLGHVRGGLHYVLVGGDVPGFRHLRLQGRRHGGRRAGAVSGDESARRASPAISSRFWLRPARMTETIPPSLVLITIGSVTGVSIAALFTGGLLPARRAGAGPVCSSFSAAIGARSEPAMQRSRQRAVRPRASSSRCPPWRCPFVIRAAVVEGVATATEVSTIGIAYAALAGF